MTRKQAIEALRLQAKGYYDYPQVTRYVTEHKDRVPSDHVVITTRKHFDYNANTGEMEPTGKTSYIHVSKSAVEAIMEGTLKSYL